MTDKWWLNDDGYDGDGGDEQWFYTGIYNAILEKVYLIGQGENRLDKMINSRDQSSWNKYSKWTWFLSKLSNNFHNLKVDSLPWIALTSEPSTKHHPGLRIAADEWHWLILKNRPMISNHQNSQAQE